MPSPIWTRDALSSEATASTGRGWRLVEAQHRVSTLKLTDSLAEQALLEDLIETTKPPMPPECRPLDYLLATPFRYGAYPSGSRFRRAGRTPGVFYGSARPQTAVAELAFHRLLFFAESPATPWPKGAAEYTAFSFAYGTEKALDLTRPPLDADRPSWTDPADYGPCQALAETAREAGIDLVLYESVRDPGHGLNLALLACTVFARPRPIDRRNWRIRLSDTGVQAICEFPDIRIGFGRDSFAADPRIAALDWER